MKKTTLLLVICSIVSSLHAYENSFFNNTNELIGIAIQYTGNDNTEPLYKHLVKPSSMVNFTPGTIGIPEIKWGFCLDKIYYIENPTPEQKTHNFEKTEWREIPITWTKTKSLTKKTSSKSTKRKIPNKPITTAKKSESALEKSLCRDRHFDIIRDAHGKMVITSSLIE